MIHREILERIRSKRFQEFTQPMYGELSIAEIAPTAAALLGVKTKRPTLPEQLIKKYVGAKRVVMLLVDGFALDHLIAYAVESPLLRRMIERTDVIPITSVFPSTTPAALTAIHTGMTPQEHGLPEWTLFFEEIDEIIETLPFRVLMTKGRDTLLTSGGLAEMLYDGPTVYQVLADAGVPSHVFVYVDYAKSAYSMTTQKGASVVPYANVLDLVTKLRESILAHTGYFFAYYGEIDSTMHKFGPGSREHVASLKLYFDELEAELFSKLTPEEVRDTLFVLSADHGQMSVGTERILYLNAYPELESMYMRGRRGQPILPTGGPNDVFLFIEPRFLERALELLETNLAGRAEVIPTRDVIERGWFGVGPPTAKFLRRVGNILLLPHSGHHIWYEFRPGAKFDQLGCHGGLSESEMVVPFAIGPLADLVTRR